MIFLFSPAAFVSAHFMHCALFHYDGRNIMSTGALPRRATIIGVSLAGILLSLALEYVHYRAYTAPTASSLCSLGERLDCASVALSKYSVVFGVPLPIWGFCGFLAIALAAFFRSRLLLPLTAVAAAASAVLLGLSLLSIGAVCLWCEAVHLVSFVLFGLAFAARRSDQAPLSALEATLLSLSPSFGFMFAAVLFLPPYWGAFGWKGDLPFTDGKTPEGEAWIGAAEPKLTIEEFVDYSCPHCRAASALSLRRLARYPDELRIVRRYFPRMSCGQARDNRCLAFRIAHCAGEQGKFWQTDRWLFEHSNARNDYDLNEASSEIGLDRERLAQCVEADAAYEWAANVWKTAKKLRIPGTPYYLVGERLVSQDRLPPLLDSL